MGLLPTRKSLQLSEADTGGMLRQRNGKFSTDHTATTGSLYFSQSTKGFSLYLCPKSFHPASKPSTSLKRSTQIH
jgi:hypothetical protein